MVGNKALLAWNRARSSHVSSDMPQFKVQVLFGTL